MKKSLRKFVGIVSLTSLALLVSGNSFAEDKAEGLESISADTFSCIRDMTKVNHFYVDNLLGDLEGTIAVAKSDEGGVYPPGSLVQLVPGEVMIKREKGFNAATKDWEFFELNVSPKGTEINKRGFAEVVNKFGGNCFACHIKAKPQFDMICEDDHGCDPIPINRTMIAALQNTDPRCEAVPLPEDQQVALQQLMKMLAPPQSK